MSYHCTVCDHSHRPGTKIHVEHLRHAESPPPGDTPKGDEQTPEPREGAELSEILPSGLPVDTSSGSDVAPGDTPKGEETDTDLNLGSAPKELSFPGSEDPPEARLSGETEEPDTSSEEEDRHAGTEGQALAAKEMMEAIQSSPIAYALYQMVQAMRDEAAKDRDYLYAELGKNRDALNQIVETGLFGETGNLMQQIDTLVEKYPWARNIAERMPLWGDSMFNTDPLKQGTDQELWDDFQEYKKQKMNDDEEIRTLMRQAITGGNKLISLTADDYAELRADSKYGRLFEDGREEKDEKGTGG